MALTVANIESSSYLLASPVKWFVSSVALLAWANEHLIRQATSGRHRRADCDKSTRPIGSRIRN
jgi:hypothetical protein